MRCDPGESFSSSLAGVLSNLAPFRHIFERLSKFSIHGAAIGLALHMACETGGKKGRFIYDPLLQVEPRSRSVHLLIHPRLDSIRTSTSETRIRQGQTASQLKHVTSPAQPCGHAFRSPESRIAYEPRKTTQSGPVRGFFHSLHASDVAVTA